MDHNASLFDLGLGVANGRHEGWRVMVPAPKQLGARRAL